MRAPLAVGGAAALVYVVVLVTFGASPRATDVGYQPAQPVAYSHAVHAGKLGLDCRYCHVAVETAARATIPPTQICVGCHAAIKPNQGDPKKYLLALVDQSYESGLPIPWVRIHDLPDYVYFDHSAHVSRGVGCSSCHGRVDKMEVVHQAEPLSMGWCLDCHRNPDRHIRPREKVTDMAWLPTDESQETLANLRKNIKPSTDCSTCHR